MFKQAILVILLSLLCSTVVSAQENPIAWKEGGLIFYGEIHGDILCNDGHNYWVSPDGGQSWKIVTNGLWRDGTMPDYGLWGGIFNDCFILYNMTKDPNPWEHELGRGFYYLSVANNFWEYIKLPQERYDSVMLKGILPLNKDTIFAWFRIQSKNKLYKTFDQGANWFEITEKIPGDSFVNLLTSTNKQRLVMEVVPKTDSVYSPFETLLFSDDYGESWQIGGNGLPDSSKFTVVSQDNNGDAICNVRKTENGDTKTKGLYITTDGYQTFQKFSLEYFGMSDTLFSFSQVQLIDSMLYITVPFYDSNWVNIGYQLYFSSNFGLTWKLVVDRDTILTTPARVANYNGGYLLITNGYYILEHLDSVGARILFGTVMNAWQKKITVASGNSLSLTNTGNQPYVQTSSYTSISHDHGISWEMKKNDSIRLADTKWHVSNSIIYAPGVKDSNACIFTSTDNGDSWSPLSYIAKGAEAHWVQVSNDTIVTLLSSKQVYVSIDRGATWREVTYTPTPLLASIEPIYVNGKVFCVSEDRRGIVRYSFASDLWNVVTMPDTLPPYGQYSGGANCDGMLYMFTNYYGYDASYVPLPLVYSSDDLGEAWSIFDAGLPDTAYVSSYTVNDNTLYAIVSDMKKGAPPDNNLYYVEKGKDAWQSTSINSYLPSEVYASDSYVYLKNDRGLYRYPVSLVSVPITEDVPTNTFDIYPNPASTSVTIRYGEFGAVSYVCMDIVGKMYQFGQLEQGLEECNIDIQAFPSGSYTLRLQNADGEVASRRFVVVK